MSGALPLPPRPNLEQYKKLARDFQHACRSSDPGAIRDWSARWAETIALLQGLEITPEIRRQIDVEAGRIEQRWRKFKKTNERAGRCALADAQFFVARGHGFASWPKFAKHIEALARADSPVSNFEAAADAIVSGDLARLGKLGRTSVVDFLLQQGMNVDAKLRQGETGMHWAAFEGHADTVKLLLERGAPVDAKDESYGGTPLGWALYAWGNSTEKEAERGRYYEVVATLVRAGARLDPQWYEDDEDRQRAAEKMRSDPRMLAALRGEMPR